MKEVMKEVVVEEPHKAEMREIPVPELPGENEVLIQMKSAGVCDNDHHIYHSLNPCSTYPHILGHENAGVVVKAGNAVINVKMGDCVTVDLIPTCGACYQCRIGRRNVCERVRVGGSGADDGWREHFTAPASEVYKIDGSVDWKDAVPVGPYAISAHCTDRARVVPEDVVFILGAGTIGSIILQTYRAKGCQMVICCDIDDVSLQRAKEYGADHIINSKTEDAMKRMAEITHNHGVAVALDSTCFPGPLTACMQPEILCNTKRMVPLSFSTVKEEITQAMINQRKLGVIGSRMSCFQFEPTIQRIENGESNTKGITTMFIPFSEIDGAFYYMNHPCMESEKMVILFD